MRIKIDQLRDYFFALLCLISFCVLIHVNNNLYRMLIVIFCVLMIIYQISKKGSVRLNFKGFNSSWLLFVLWALLSNVWAYNRVNPMDILMLILIGIVNCIIYSYINTNNQILIFLKCAIITSLVMDVYLISKFGWNELTTQRMDNSILNSNEASLMFAIGAALALYIYNIEKKNIYLLFCGILSFSTLLMGSKTGSFSLILFTAVFYIFKDKYNIKKNIRNIIIGISIIAVIIYMTFKIDFLYNILGERIVQFFQSLQGNNQYLSKSTTVRKELMATAIGIFKQHPFLGVGLGNFNYMNVFHTYSHSNIIEIAVNLGIIGIIFFYSIHIQIFLDLRKMKSDYQIVKAFIMAMLVNYFFMEFCSVYYSRYYEIFILMMLSRYVKIKFDDER